MKFRWLGFGLALLIALGCMFKLGLAQGPAPMAGQAAPQFTLPSQDGSPVSLRDYRGRWVLLYFYPRDNTTGCTIEAHNFQRDLPKYESRNTVVLGVSLDSEDSHRGFCAKQGLTFKLLSDKERIVSAEYGSLCNLLGLRMAARNSFLIDPNGKIAKAWLDVSPSGHSAEVLAELAQFEEKKL